MKKLINSKIFWFFVSVVASLILWVYVTSVESDQYTRTLRGVAVEFVGDSVLHEKGLSVTDVSTATISVEISGPRRTVAGLNNDDISAQINVSSINQSAIASMQYTLKYPDGIDTSSISISKKIPETVTFSVSKLISKTIPVKGSFDGITAAGYTAEEPQFEPATITVSGAENIVDSISYAWVNFGDGEVSSTYTEEVGFELMTEDKEIISHENITLSDDIVLAKLPIYKINEIPLAVELVYGAGATEENTTVTIEPASIKLAGDTNVIDGINQITLSVIDLTGFESSFEDVFPIVFDDTLTNVDGIDEAKVNIKIEGLTTKTFKISSSNFSYINETEGYNVDILSKYIEVTLRGSAQDLDKVKSEHIRAVVDLSDYDATEGAALVTPLIYVDDTEGDSVGAISADKIQIEIKKA